MRHLAYRSSTRLELMLQLLEERADVQVVAGAYAQYDSLQTRVTVDDYSLLFEPIAAQRGSWRDGPLAFTTAKRERGAGLGFP